MKYYLQPELRSPSPPLEITERDYISLEKSSFVLNAAFSIEENFDLLIGNYLELEKTALSIATSALARHLSEYQEIFELRAEINRRAVNFLSTARLFVDQLSQRFKECGQDAEKAKSCLREQYDSSFEYRFMEALRNHVQHSGLAVHSHAVECKWVPPGECSQLKFSLNISTLRRFLELDRSFKQSVLAECPEQVEFLSTIRRYVESFGIVQESVRATIGPAVTNAREKFTEAIQRYTAFSKGSALGLAAFAAPSGGSKKKRVSVFLDWDDVRIKLSKRNGNLKNLSKCTITSTLH